MKFIKMMKCLRKMNNFNSYLAILSALDSAPIRRLGRDLTVLYRTVLCSQYRYRTYRAYHRFGFAPIRVFFISRDLNPLGVRGSGSKR